MYPYIVLLLALFSVSTAYGQDKLPRPLNTVDIVAGSYIGTLPCADCPGIQSELELLYVNDSLGQYRLRSKYLGKGNGNITALNEGEWIVVKDAYEGKLSTYVLLDYDDQEKIKYYILKDENNLVPLDAEKKPLTAAKEVLLHKQAKPLIEN
jgi:hypothetical protein